MTTERPPAPTTLRFEEQEPVLRARLAVPERSLKALFRKLSLLISANGDVEVAQALASYRLELDTLLFQLERIEAVANLTTEEEVRAYQRMVLQMTQEREDTLQAIEELKKELVSVQKDRKNKLEYDQLASDIMKLGTREELENQLTSLRATLQSLSEESTKYSDVMSESKSRFEGVASQLKRLRADVGFEVGERERREVEREGEGDAEEDAKAEESATVMVTGTSRRHSDAILEDDGEVGSKRRRLNPAALPFRPSGTTRESTPSEVGSSNQAPIPKAETSKRRRSARRAGGGQGEEIRSREEGEMSEGEADEEEEEEEEGAA